MSEVRFIAGHWAGSTPSMLKVAPAYETRFIRQRETQYVSVCWHASKAYGQNRSERLAYVVRQFVRKFPEYQGREGGVYKDVSCLLEGV